MSADGFPRIVQQCADVGTGPTFTLLPQRMTSYAMFRDFVSSGQVIACMIVNPGKNEWQECLCTFTQGANDTITVLEVINSSNVVAGVPTQVTFTSGNKWCMLAQSSYALKGSGAVRPNVRLAFATNQAVSGLTAGAVFQGLTLAAEDRVGLFNQTTGTQNGIYIVQATGAPVLAPDCFTGDTISGIFVPILAGTYAGGYAMCVSPSGSDIVGTSATAWSLWSPGTAGNVTATQPTTVDTFAFWNTATGQLSSTSDVATDAKGRLLFGAESGAFDVASYGATINFDLGAANQWETTLAGNPTLTVSNVLLGQFLYLLINQDATGGRLIGSWFGNVEWNNNLPPVLTPQPGGWDQIVLQCIGFDAYGVPMWNEICRSTSAPRLQQITATDGATVAFNLDVSPQQIVTLGGNRALVFNGTYWNGRLFDLSIAQDATGGHTVTWPSGITWAAGSAPVLSTAPGAVDEFIFKMIGAGLYYGYIAAQGL